MMKPTFRWIKFIPFLLLFVLGEFIYSQNGDNYALIIGVSEYEHPNISPLKYADKDAVSFYSALTSDAFGVDTNNVILLTNQDATVSNIISKYSWLENTPKSGDRVYIFFSGHGDAVSPELAYLLPYDVNASDPHFYAVSAIGITQLKVLCKNLWDRGVQPFLIMDACRTNELSDMDKSKSLVTGAIDREYGAIQFTSSAQNESSFEDYRWGNGHGVFSYYLIKGMLGLADKDEDSLVTVYELYSYTKENVTTDTRDRSTNTTLQKPSFCCTEYEDTVVAVVNNDILERIKLTEDEIVVVDDVFAYATTKGNLTNNWANSKDQVLFDSIYACFNSHRFYYPKYHNASSHIKKLLELNKTDPHKTNLVEARLLNYLIEKVQIGLNTYLNESPDQYSTRFIKSNMEMTNLVLDIIGTESILYDHFKKLQSFFTAQYYISTRDYDDALSEVYTGLKYNMDAAYLHHTKGVIFAKLNSIDSAMVSFDKAIELSPNWSLPYEAKGYIQLKLGQPTIAKTTIRNLLEANKKAYNYCMAADFYFSLDDIKQSKDYYREAIEKDDQYLRPKIGLMAVNGVLSESNSWDWDLSKSDSLYYLEKNAKYFERVLDFDKAANVYLELYKIDTTNIEFLAKHAITTSYSGTVNNATTIIVSTVSSQNKFIGYNSLVEMYSNLGEYDSVIYYQQKLLALDAEYNPVNLYNTYLKLGNVDSATIYLEKTFSDAKFYSDLNYAASFNGLAKAYLRNRMPDSALAIMERIYDMGVEDCDCHATVGKIYYALNDKKSIDYLNKAITCDPKVVDYYLQQSLNYERIGGRKDSILYYVSVPYNKFGLTEYNYLKWASYTYSRSRNLNGKKTLALKGIELYPDDPVFYLHLAVYYWDVGLEDKFYSYFELSIDKGLNYQQYLPHSYLFEPTLNNDDSFQRQIGRIKN